MTCPERQTGRGQMLWPLNILIVVSPEGLHHNDNGMDFRYKIRPFGYTVASERVLLESDSVVLENQP
jgi:hypothetical protein